LNAQQFTAGRAQARSGAAAHWRITVWASRQSPTSLDLLHPDDAERNDLIAYMRDLIDLSARLNVNLVTPLPGATGKSVEDNIRASKKC
jgi:hypothetical protein